MLPELMKKLLDPKDKVPEVVDFEFFVRIVAIILEENNKLPDEALGQNDEIEEEVVEKSTNSNKLTHH